MIEKMLVQDARLSLQMQIAKRPGWLRTIAILLAHSGDSWFWLVGLAMVWWLGSTEWQVRSAALIAGILITATLVMGIKFTVRRQRPVGEWGNIYRKTDPHSFPSGHAARAAMLAVMAVGLGPLWFTVLMILWAPLVGLARVAMGVHYLLDILAGMVIGIGMGLLTLWAAWSLSWI